MNRFAVFAVYVATSTASVALSLSTAVLVDPPGPSAPQPPMTPATVSLMVHASRYGSRESIDPATGVAMAGGLVGILAGIPNVIGKAQ